MVTAVFSDRWGKRGFFLMFWSALAAIGYLLFITIPVQFPVSIMPSIFHTGYHAYHTVGCSILCCIPHYLFYCSLHRYNYRVVWQYFWAALQEGHLYGFHFQSG